MALKPIHYLKIDNNYPVLKYLSSEFGGKTYCKKTFFDSRELLPLLIFLIRRNNNKCRTKNDGKTYENAKHLTPNM